MRSAILTGSLVVVGCQADATSTCTLPAVLDAVRAVVPDARYTSDPDDYLLFAPLIEAEEPDMLVLELRGSFAEHGAVVELTTCPACVLVYPRWNAERGSSEAPYLATSGVLRFTTLSPDFMAGTLHDVMLAPADFDTKAGCTATLTRLELAAVPESEHDWSARDFKTLRRAGR